MSKQSSSISELINKFYPGKNCIKTHKAVAGRILKKQGKEAVIAYLADKVKDFVGNFNAPAKCLILAKSRPFEEWPICKASTAIQQYVYSLSKDQFDLQMPGTSKTSHSKYLESAGIDTFGFDSVQGRNKIFPHTLNRYKGVITKVENRNEKRLKKLKTSEKSKFIPESAFDVDGKLIHPPGLNYSLYCWQEVSPYACKTIPSSIALTLGLKQDTIDPDAIIAPLTINRLAILKGQPGYVPEFQYSSLSSKTNRRRKVYGKLSKPILARIDIGDDWVIIDLRGLLRNARWRGLVPKEGISPNGLLDLFSGDPVINTKYVHPRFGETGEITFCYKQEYSEVYSRTILSEKAAPKILNELTKDGKKVASIDIDLGVANPIAAQVWVNENVDGKIIASKVKALTLPKEILKDLEKATKKINLINLEIKDTALKSLPEEQRNEILRIESQTEEKTKERVLDWFFNYFDKPKDLPWSEMTSQSNYIANACINAGCDKSCLTRKRDEKLLTDANIYELVKIKYDSSIRSAYDNAKREAQRSSKEYVKLSKSKKELARRSVNWIINQAKQITGCDQVIICFECLEMPFFSNPKGSRNKGWNQFHQPKAMKDWMIQENHGAISDLPLHRGMFVFEPRPHGTSIKCPMCRNWDPDNRKAQARFECTKCSYIGHPDLDVAPYNLQMILLTGKALSKTDLELCERFGDTKIAVPTRNAEIVKDINDIDKQNQATDRHNVISKFVEMDDARKADGNAA